VDDFDRRMQSLRRSLQDRISAPSPDDLAARARRRRTQRAAQYTVVGLVAVLAVIVPVLTMANGRHGARPATPGPESAPSTVTVPTTVPTTVTVTTPPSTATSHAVSAAGTLVYDADFRDPFHVYALVGVPTDQGAVTRLYVTADRGRSWSQHPTPLPPVTGDNGYSADLVMLGRDRLLLRNTPGELPDIFPPGVGLGADGWPMWYSADGGVNWLPVPSRVAAPLGTIPDGAILATRCGTVDTAGNRDCAGRSLVAFLPGSGQFAELKAQPELQMLPAARIEPAADGRWWVAGTVGGAPAVAVSADGSSWAVKALPVTGTPIAIEVATAGSRAWAVVRGSTDTEKNALLGVAYSADAGGTWKLTYAPSLGTAPRTFVGAPVPNVPSPGVIISTDVPNDDMSYLVLNDGSTVAAARPAAGWTRWTGTGYVSIADNTVNVSSDGMTFMPLRPLG
jgi:hypothetical protein